MHNKNEKKITLAAFMICGLGALYYCYEYLLRIAPSVMETPLREHFGLSATGFGILSASYYYAYVPLQVPVGVLLDRYGPKLLLSAACAICVFGSFMFSSTHLFWVAFMGRFLVGFGSAFAFVGVLKLATIWLPEDKLGMVAGLASALGTIGAMLGDNVMSRLVVTIGWKDTINWSALFGIILTVVLWYGIKDRKSYQRASGTISNFKRSMRDLAIIAKNKQIWLNGLFGCLVYLPTTVFAELWGIPYLEHAHNMPKHEAGFANSLVFFGFLIGAPLMGYLSDRLKRRKLPMLLGSAGAGIVMITLLYMPGLSFKQIDILLLSLGLLYSSQPLVFAVGRELSPNAAAGTAMAMTNMIVMLGAMLLQPLIGRLLDYSLATHMSMSIVEHASNLKTLYTPSDYKFALSIIPIGIVTASLLTFFLKETYADTIE